MPKKRGLGRDINKSLEIMDNLLNSLRDFAHSPLKKGLVSNNVQDEDMQKMFNKASEQAFALINMVGDLEHKVKGLNINRSSRFASSDRVVQKFLASQP